jgi:hypothetical protein
MTIPHLFKKKHKMRGYRGKKQFTEINHSNRAKKTGLSGYKAIYRNQSFKKKPQCGIIGVKVILQQSIIQNRAKNAGYRGKMQFTEINHSNRAKKCGL